MFKPLIGCCFTIYISLALSQTTPAYSDFPLRKPDTNNVFVKCEVVDAPPHSRNLRVIFSPVVITRNESFRLINPPRLNFKTPFDQPTSNVESFTLKAKPKYKHVVRYGWRSSFAYGSYDVSVTRPEGKYLFSTRYEKLLVNLDGTGVNTYTGREGIEVRLSMKCDFRVPI